jgi:prophage regulatory protein
MSWLLIYDTEQMMYQSKTQREQCAQANDQPQKLIRIKSVVNLTGLSKSYIYDLCKKGLFPESLQLVPGGTSVAWVRSEVLAWIDSRIQSRDSENLAQTNQ